MINGPVTSPIVSQIVEPVAVSLRGFLPEQAAPAAGIVTNGLEMYINANEVDSYSGSGSTWSDLTANNYDATLFQPSSLPTFVDSGTNKSLEFNGVNQYANFGDNLDVNLDSITLNVWIYPMRIDGTSNQTVWSKAEALGDPDRLAIQQKINTTRLFCFYSPTGNSAVDINLESSTSLSLNTWYMITMVFDRQGDMTLYINGVADTSVDISAWQNEVINGPFPYRFAAYSDRVTYTPRSEWKGRISIAHHYNRALSSSEVLQNFNADKALFGYST